MSRSSLTAAFLTVATAAAAQAQQTWVFEPGQSLVSVEVGPKAARISAASPSLNGQLVEQGGGLVKAALRLDLASFATGARAHDALLREAAGGADAAPILFEGTAPASGTDGKLHFTGTLTVRGVGHPFELTVATVHMGSALYGHVSFTLHLRNFGFALPAALPDEAHVDIDAGLRPERGALASRG